MQEPSSLAFGMVRLQTPTTAPSAFVELCEELGRAAGTKVFPFHARSYEELAAAMESGSIQLAWMPPITGIHLEERGLCRPLALPVRRGSTTYSSALVVRKGGAKRIEDLRRLRAAWVAAESAAGYVVPRAHLAALGLDPATFFAAETFCQTHYAVVDAVVTGRADVGATFCTLDATGKRIVSGGWTDAEGRSVRPVDVVTTIGPIPNDAIVASPRLPAEITTATTRFLFQLKGRARVLANDLFFSADFRTATPHHFEPLRHLVRMARARGYDAASGLRARAADPPARE